MIIDKFENIELYLGLSSSIKKAVDYIKHTDFPELKSGKYEIDGDRMFVYINEYTTKKNELNILEAHKKYIDFQYVIKGQEILEYEALGTQKIHKQYDEKDDYFLCFGKNKNRLIFEEGMFSILFPNDLHLPGVLDEKESFVKKVVIKILID